MTRKHSRGIRKPRKSRRSKSSKTSRKRKFKMTRVERMWGHTRRSPCFDKDWVAEAKESRGRYSNYDGVVPGGERKWRFFWIPFANNEIMRLFDAMRHVCFPYLSGNTLQANGGDGYASWRKLKLTDREEEEIRALLRSKGVMFFNSIAQVEEYLQNRKKKRRLALLRQVFEKISTKPDSSSTAAATILGTGMTIDQPGVLGIMSTFLDTPEVPELPSVKAAKEFTTGSRPGWKTYADPATWGSHARGPHASSIPDDKAFILISQDEINNAVHNYHPIGRTSERESSKAEEGSKSSCTGTGCVVSFGSKTKSRKPRKSRKRKMRFSSSWQKCRSGKLCKSFPQEICMFQKTLNPKGICVNRFWPDLFKMTRKEKVKLLKKYNLKLAGTNKEITNRLVRCFRRKFEKQPNFKRPKGFEIERRMRKDPNYKRYVKNKLAYRRNHGTWKSLKLKPAHCGASPCAHGMCKLGSKCSKPRVRHKYHPASKEEIRRMRKFCMKTRSKKR